LPERKFPKKKKSNNKLGKRQGGKRI
jgi:hypothetical protein